ncbi:MAG: ribonuclease III [Pigmentiphaga sp.]
MDALKRLQQRLDYTFARPALLEQALTHRSHGSVHNERLEFLGDSVLNCAVAALLYARFDRIDEGDLSRVRASLVRQETLADIAQRLALSEHLRLGEGELKSGGFRRPSILADALEAIFGAIFVDSGFDAAHRVIASIYQPLLATLDPRTLGKDAKTLLQEYLQSRRSPLPQYRVLSTQGAAHDQQFLVECHIAKYDLSVTGQGGSRRAAEQQAAQDALRQLQALAGGGAAASRPRVVVSPERRP